jgi:hypothetical protein
VASYMRMMRLYMTSCQIHSEHHHHFCSMRAYEAEIPVFIQQQRMQLHRYQVSVLADQFLLGQQHYIQVTRKCVVFSRRGVN